MKRSLIFIFVLLSLSLLLGNAQQRDSRTRLYLSPTRIVWQQDSAQITGTANLLRQGNGQTDLQNKYICTLKSTDKLHPALLLDFGKELQGGLQLVSGMPASHNPIKVRVRFGESVSEAMCDIDGENGATNDHALRDFVISIPWLGVQEVGNSGFRFVRIDLLDDSVELRLKEVRAIATFRDISYKGSFRCNDEKLNRIWQTGAYTVHLNMQEYLWDGIKRDRLVWIGDMYPEIMTINSAFGYNEVVPKSLDLARDITPLPSWMSGMCAYSLWWILIQRDWYLYQGNLSYLKEQQSYLTDLLRLLLKQTDGHGHEQLPSGGGRFLDWPSSENEIAIDAGMQALMVEAISAGSKLCTVLGDKTLADECKQMAEKMTDASKERTNALLKIRMVPYAPGNKEAAALLSLSGLMNPQEADQKFLSVGGAKGFSTFYGYYMLRAMALAGNYEGALNVIRQFWGGMLDLGATTFWEDFNMDWLSNAARIDNLVPAGKVDVHKDYGAYCYKGYRHSLCHGWASGPTAWLSEYVLGVQVIEPGCKVVRITPHLGDLKWVEGTFPTPYGVITIRHEKGTDGKVKSTIQAPKEVRVVQN